VRDGTRLFALCLPLYAGLPAAGAEWLADRAGRDDRAARGLVPVLVAVLVVPLLYDAAWGVSGALRPVDYPASWAQVRGEADLSGGDVLVLPFSAYRAPVWNHRRTVLDPLGRYLPANYLADDSLVVDRTTVPGDDPRVAEVTRALALDTPQARTQALLALGVRTVVTETDLAGPGRGVVVEADVVARAPGLLVQRLRGAAADRTPGWGSRLLLGVAWAAYLGALVVGLAGAARQRWARWHARRRQPVA
jgi:hypothetical protein